MAPPPWYFLPWGWRVLPTVPGLPYGRQHGPTSGLTRLGGIPRIMFATATLVARVTSYLGNPCTTAGVPSFEGARCVTLWCGLHVPHCARPSGYSSGAPVRGGSLEFFKVHMRQLVWPAAKVGEGRPTPGRVSLGKGGEVFAAVPRGSTWRACRRLCVGHVAGPRGAS